MAGMVAASSMAGAAVQPLFPRYDPVVAPQSNASDMFVKEVGHEYA
jgi:hypothetical protein